MIKLGLVGGQQVEVAAEVFVGSETIGRLLSNTVNTVDTIDTADVTDSDSRLLSSLQLPFSLDVWLSYLTILQLLETAKTDTAELKRHFEANKVAEFGHYGNGQQTQLPTATLSSSSLPPPHATSATLSPVMSKRRASAPEMLTSTATTTVANCSIPAALLGKMEMALYVMDYLENRQQLRLWYEHVYYHYRLDLTDIQQLLQHTSFTMSDIDLFFGSTSISQMIARIKSQSSLPHDYLNHIYNSLYKDNSIYTTDYLQQLLFHVNLASVRDYNSTFTSSAGWPSCRLKLRWPLINQFIRIPNSIPLRSDSRAIAVISPRVAAHYEKSYVYYSLSRVWPINPDSNAIPSWCGGNTLTSQLASKRASWSPTSGSGYYYDHHYHQQQQSASRGSGLLFICPDSHPYFTVEHTIAGRSTYHFFHRDNKVGMHSLSMVTDKLLVTNDYLPLSYHDTGLSLGCYSLQTYNLPTLDDDGYYCFLVHEIDPISKALYAFSL